MWRTISISSAFMCIALLIWPLMNPPTWLNDGFTYLNSRAVIGLALWCSALGLAYKLIPFARDKADGIETPDERLPGYPKTLRFAGVGALIVAGASLANFGLWHWGLGDMSQKQMLKLAMIPLFIVSYYVIAYGNPADR